MKINTSKVLAKLNPCFILAPIWLALCVTVGAAHSSSIDEATADIRIIGVGTQITNNIYNEMPFMDASSRYVIYIKLPSSPGSPSSSGSLNQLYDRVEVWRADLETGKSKLVCDNLIGVVGMGVSPDQCYFYACRSSGPRESWLKSPVDEIVEIEIGTLKTRSIKLRGEGLKLRSMGSVTPDNRMLITSVELVENRFGIVRIDLDSGEYKVIHEGGREIQYPHVQIDKANGNCIIVFRKRGAPDYPTMYAVDREGDNRRDLQAGRPYTARLQGHQCFIGAKKSILQTTIPKSFPETFEGGNLIETPCDGSASRVVAKGYFYLHCNASRCSRYFVSDTGGEDKLAVLVESVSDQQRKRYADRSQKSLIVVGSIKTGKTAVLCRSRAALKGPQYTHSHPYLSPDAKWVIFNTENNGIPSVAAARVPDGLLEELDKPSQNSSTPAIDSRSKDEDKRLNDFSRCTPRENFITEEQESLWRVVRKPLDGSEIAVLESQACVASSAVRYPLDAVGKHKVSVGIYVDKKGLPSSFRLGLADGSYPAEKDTIKQSSTTPGPRIEEHTWKSVDLTGNDLMIWKTGGRPIRIVYFRLQPLDERALAQSHVDKPRYRGAEAEKRFPITLNEQQLPEEQAWFRLSIGKLHSLKVATAAGDACRVEVIKIMPNGQTEKFSATLDADARQAALDLGPLCVPTQYEFEHGSIYRVGYRLQIRVHDQKTDQLLARFDFYQGIPLDHSGECLYAGRERRVLHGPPRKKPYYWWVSREDSYALYPPLFLKLSWPPVKNGSLRIKYRYRDIEGTFPVVLHIEDHQGKTMVPDSRIDVPAGWPGVKNPHERLPAGKKWGQTAEKNVADWPEGKYKISLWPVVDGKTYREGPTVTYVHTRPRADKINISPYANWTLDRDDSRPKLLLNNMETAVVEYGQGKPDAQDWKLHDGNLVTVGNVKVPPVRISPRLSGYYAVFARPVTACLLQFSGEDFPRPVRVSPSQPELFVACIGMTDRSISLLPSHMPGKGLGGLRFEPVSLRSAQAFLAESQNPPLPVSGVADWHSIYSNPASYSAGGADVVQIDAIDFEMLYYGHRELGMPSVDWACGRNFLLYHSDLPNTSLIGEHATDQTPVQYVKNYQPLLKSTDPLNEVVKLGKKYQQYTSGWLCMNRCYGGGHRNTFASKFYDDNPQWYFRKKSGAVDNSRVCYFFPQIRQERVAILTEIAQRGVDCLLVDFNRQPPMIGYHPEMVKAFTKETGIDPRKIDASSPEEYLRWINWRAQFITTLLRDLRASLAELEKKTGRNVHIAARIHSDGLLANLASGCAVRNWCEEGLVDELHIVPLCTSAGGQSIDARPYLELGQKHQVKICGGVNKILGAALGFTSYLRRAIGLAEAGVDSIEVYESEELCQGVPLRWWASLTGNPQRARRFLEESNLEACFPIDAWSAVGGWDNHFPCILHKMFEVPDYKDMY